LVYPFLVSCAYIALLAGVLYSTYFSFSAGLTFTAPQLVLIALLAAAVIQPRRRTLGGAPGVFLLAFIGLLLLASVLAVQSGRVDAFTTRSYVQPFFYLLFYFVVIRLIPEPERMRKLLTYSVGLAAVVGVVALGVALFGSLSSPLQDPGNQYIYPSGGIGGLLRVRLPGVALAYGLFWYAVVELQRADRRRWLWGLALLGMFISVGVSLNRNMWIGLVLGLATLLVIGGAPTRQRLLTSLVIAASAISVLLLLGPQASGPGSRLEPIVKRGETLLSPSKEAGDTSLQDRASETDAAWSSLHGHFITGLGAGASYGATYTANLGGGRYERSDRLFIHNQYLYLWVAGGIFALLAFLGFVLATLGRFWKTRRDPAMAGLFVGLAMVMVSAVVMMAFIDPGFMTLFALIAAAGFTLAPEAGRRVASRRA
jgi:O-antigen ligase